MCRSWEGRDLADVAKHKHCMEDAVADAVTELDRPRLTACYLAHHGGQSPLVVSSSARTGIAKSSVSVH